MNCLAKSAWETGVCPIIIAVCCFTGCGGDWEAGKDDLKEIAQKIESAYFARAQAKEARQAWYQCGYEAGKIAAMTELREGRTRMAIGWGFATGMVCGLCLIGLISARRINEFLCRRKARSLRLLKSRPEELCPDVRHLAEMLSARQQELRRRIKSSGRTPLARVMKSVGAEADSVVRRSAKLLTVLQDLNTSVEKAMRGRIHFGEQHCGATDAVWSSSIKHAQARIADCRGKVKATIDLLDSILLRLSGLEMASVDGCSIAEAVTDIHREIEALEEAYGELATASA